MLYIVPKQIENAMDKSLFLILIILGLQEKDLKFSACYLKVATKTFYLHIYFIHNITDFPQ